MVSHRGVAAALAILAVVPWCAPAARGGDPVILSETDRSVELEIQIPEPRLHVDPSGRSWYEIPGYGVLAADGLPVVPRRVLRVATGGPVTGLEVEVLASRRLPAAAPLLLAVPRRIPDLDDPAGPGTPVPGTALPSPVLAWPFPSQVARLEGEGWLRRLPVAEVALTPLRLLDPGGEAELATRIRLRLRWSEPSGSAARQKPAAPLAEPFDRLYPGAVVNPAGARPRPDASGRPPAAALPGAPETSSSTGLTGEAAAPEAEASPVLRRALPVSPQVGSAVYRLTVAVDGVHHLSGAWLAANTPDLAGRPVDRLFMAANGVEIPIRVVDDGNGIVSTGDRIVFFGEAVDEDPLDPDTWQQGDFTDRRPYYLGVADGPRLRMSTLLTGAPVSGFPVAASFTETVHHEEDDFFINTISSDADDRWYDGPLLLQTAPSRTLTLALPGVAPGGQASLAVRMLGQIIGGNLNGYHRTRLRVNGSQVSQADWDGVVVFTQGVDDGPITFPTSFLTASTGVQVDLPLDRVVDGTPVTTDLVALNWVEITYPRLFAASGDRLRFSVPNADTRFVVTGLSAPDAAVYDLTPAAGGVAAPRHLSGAQVSGTGPYTVTFEIAAADDPGATRRLAVAAGAGLQPAAVALHAPGPDLAAGGADWLLIGPRSLLDEGPSSALSSLVALRQSQGWQTRVASLRDVYDTFSFGLEDPQAIRDAIAWVLAQWSPAPTFVVLVGDATLDYKNSYGHAMARNLTPTYMESQVASPVLTYFAADNRFAAVVGNDELPDVLLGRLPAHSLAEAEGIFSKVVSYESLAGGPAWTRRGFFISDAESGGFESTMRQAIGKYFDRPENPGVLDPTGPCFSTGTCRNDPLGPGPLFHTASMQALISRNPSTPVSTLATTMNGWIRDGINLGGSVTQFNGHGSFQSWGRDATIYRSRSFAADDIDQLTNGSTLTFMLNINCITGGFHADSPPGAASDQLYSFAEDILLTPGRGVIGIIAPSHLTFISLLTTATNTFWDRLLGEERDRLLGAINLSLRLRFGEVGADVDLRSFSFLGDPATRLILPDPAPPSSFQAVAGNGVVDLSWVAGPDALTFRVERSSFGPSGPYTVLTPPGFAATVFSDTAVTNGKTYHYRVTGRDGDGMDTVPSNRNLDCPSGPGCVAATPINLTPPVAPSGFTVTDTGGGGELLLQWTANPEPDIALYRVRLGTTSGLYETQQSFPAASTSALLRGLQDGVTYYLVLEAENTSGVVGPPTAEREGMPQYILGLSPPAPITDLRVSDDAGDAMLSWSQVLLDIYGRPTTVQEYRIYASEAGPLFPLDPPHQIGSVADGPSPTFMHVGGASGPQLRFYLVSSRDTSGVDSGGGLGLPAPILDLMVSELAPGTLRLTWSPITRTTQNAPLVVDHYVVYAAATPFSRADVDGMIPIRSGLQATTVDVDASEGSYFSVLAVDARGGMSPY